MADRPPPQFELVGDPADLPDAFFDALAGLLLSIDAGENTEPKAERESE